MILVASRGLGVIAWLLLVAVLGVIALNPGVPSLGYVLFWLGVILEACRRCIRATTLSGVGADRRTAPARSSSWATGGPSRLASFRRAR